MIKVFKYGALPPEDGGNIRGQIKLGRQYYNRLVEAENKRRIKVWIAIFLCSNSSPHVHKDDDPPCEECKDWWEMMRGRFWSLPALDKIPYRTFASAAGLYWGTYLLVEQAFAAACRKRSPFLPIKFSSWQDGGYMGVQIQSGSKAESFFQIEPAFDPRVGRRAGQRHTIRFRVGTKNRKPVWSDSLRFEQHRPVLGTPTWAKACMEYCGDREIWSAHVTCKDVPDTRKLATDRAVAIDMSWRSMDDKSIRLAFATGDDGREFMLSMNGYWRERWDRADRIRGERDRRLNELKAADTRFAQVEKPRGVRKYVAKHRLMDLEIGEWIKRDKHLEQYELGCRRRCVNARNDTLRVWLSKLVKEYKVAVIKDSSYKEMKDHKKAVKNGMFPRARFQGHQGAPGLITEEVCIAFDRERNVAVVEAPGTTATCLECGHESQIGAELIAVCERCGAREDRDRVSARNMLRLYSEGSNKKPRARKKEARFAKRHKKNGEARQCQRDGL